MKIIKNINNNYVIALDKKGNQVVLSGRGIGFGTVPRELTDLSKVNRSFYDVEDIYISMINEIPEVVIEISTAIIDYARSILDNSVSSNIIFTLADHINFSIQRYKQNLNMKLPILNDIQYLFEKEIRIGEYGVKLIRKKMGIYLPQEEAAYIALHIINAEERNKNTIVIDDDTIIEQIIRIIENVYGFSIEREGVNYSRFVSHLHYLFKRGKSKHLIESKNSSLYKTVSEDYPNSTICADQINLYLSNIMKINLTDEEKLYLILHINRLCTREDRNQ